MPFVYAGQWQSPAASASDTSTAPIAASNVLALLRNARTVHRRSVRVLHASAPAVTVTGSIVVHAMAPIRTSRDTRPAQYLRATGGDITLTVDVYTGAGVLVGSGVIVLGASPASGALSLGLSLASDTTYYLRTTAAPTGTSGTLDTVRLEEQP